MNNSSALGARTAVTDAYTDLQGLQRLRNNPDKDAALRQVAQQFESMFLSLMLKNMRQANAVFEEDSLFNNNESHLIRDMYDNQLSLNMAHAQSTGLADVLYRQLSGQYGAQLGTQAEGAKPVDAAWRRETSARVPSASESPANVSKGLAQRVALADNPADFVERLWPHAQAAAEQLGTDPAILLAQAALETGWGKHVLADADGTSSHNLFNIKASAQWRGETVPVQALEYRDGVAVREQSQFKKYQHPADSFSDFVALVKNNPRYVAATKTDSGVEGFIKSLHQAGYATDPRYADKVMAVYQDINQNISRSGNTSAPTLAAGDPQVGEG